MTAEDGEGIAYRLRGWGNPLPIEIVLDGPAQIAGLRRQIATDLKALEPRLATLDRNISVAAQQRGAYRRSKNRIRFPLQLAPSAPWRCAPAGARARDIQPRRVAIRDGGTSLATLFDKRRGVVCVGEPQSLAIGSVSARQATMLLPGEGALVPTRSGASRPGRDSFAGWWADATEAQRQQIRVFVLGRSAGRLDMELLRHRLYPHQKLIAESGSVAAAWLVATWDGTIERAGAALVFAEPGREFREPSRLGGIAPGRPWPKISVVTVSYNQRDYLEDCLRSVVEQDYPNLEYIVVDACSTDGSIEVLRRWEPRLTRLIIEPDEGQSDGLNKGFREADGVLMTWVNSDDMLAPQALRRAALAYDEFGCDLIAGSCERIAEREPQHLHNYHSALPTNRVQRFDLSGPLAWAGGWEAGDYFFQPEVFFTRDIWRRAGGYLKPHLFWAMDWDFWLRCAMAGAAIVRIPDPIGVSRIHDAQKTTSEELYLHQVANILREYDDLFAATERDLSYEPGGERPALAASGK